MDWIRRNAVVLIFVLAVAGAFVLNRVDAESGQDQARADNLTLCVLANEGRALDAAYKRRTADARRASGDAQVADDYDAFARGVEENLAIARYLDHPVEAAQVELTAGKDGEKYTLTAHSKALIAEGCERSLRD
jgi:hypothetical protein